MTYPKTTSHIALNSQVFSSLLTRWCDPQRSVSPWSAWRPEASAPRRSRWRSLCRNRQRSGGCRGCARTATWPRTTSVDRFTRRLAPANPAELRALLTRVYHRTWAGSREMFEKIGNAWVRRLKACVAAKGGKFEQRS